MLSIPTPENENCSGYTHNEISAGNSTCIDKETNFINYVHDFFNINYKVSKIGKERLINVIGNTNGWCVLSLKEIHDQIV